MKEASRLKRGGSSSGSFDAGLSGGCEWKPFKASITIQKSTIGERLNSLHTKTETLSCLEKHLGKSTSGFENTRDDKTIHR